MRHVLAMLVCCGVLGVAIAAAAAAPDGMLQWHPLPDLPATIGVAGPIVGVSNDALIVAGGANFPTAAGEDLWAVPKVWHSDAWVLVKEGDRYRWLSGFALDRPVAYAACATTHHGIVCIGGSDQARARADCFLLTWNPATKQITQQALPALPQPCAHGSAAVIGEIVYVAGGQSGMDLETAMTNFWRLDMANPIAWERLPGWCGPSRALNLTVAQHNGFDDCIYVVSGRRQRAGVAGIAGIETLVDVYEFNPHRFDVAAFDADANRYAGTGEFAHPWRRRADVPFCVMAGTAAPIGQSHIVVLSGADGRLLAKAAELKEKHPGFPRRALVYHTITDTWIDAGHTPANQVTTPATVWDGRLVVASGEVRPRVRSSAVWAVQVVTKAKPFGAVNFTVLAVYLLGMVGVGVYFSGKNKNTDDYFRGGQQVAWWAAGCSIFATMLSSITFMAVPAKAFAQNTVYLLGNMMILAVAPVAVYLALPFFRQIDATSAYEYLQKRFNWPVRLIASLLFDVFHVFRMGIVLSLAALALATITPITAPQCVLIMGVLSIIYCTMGGVEAVIWTDTIQTGVLLGGALLCFFLMIAGVEGGLSGFFTTAVNDGKLHSFNLHLDPTSASLALWVVVIGAIGQNISSYTADQAVVQRYMTTPDTRRAGASIWTAAILAVPASLLFFGTGSALYVFYKSHPERLDPTFMTDQIFPLFISREVPIGIAGLIVAGIFAAAQSTISTSMNSTASAVVTDFLRPLRVARSEHGYLNWARGLTFLFGALGTLLGLLFIDPSKRSLLDEFLWVIGMFMGVLGGLFLLGMLTRRATGWGALLGAIAGTGVTAWLKLHSPISGYLYAAIGITTCLVVGYLASLFLPGKVKSLDGLTVYTMTGQKETTT